ncbi:MAG: oligosaccharide flippase family protein, partial [Phaeodactylibacter sp.]|nr:oligosaccharide flippase family protein [Phaeodactylibacter sp.]
LQIYTPVLFLNISRVRDLIRFGLFEAGNQLANLASTQVDKILIGRLLGAEMLGLYTIAWELIVFPIARINPIITKVAFPVYARLQHAPARLSRYYRRAVSILLLVNVPALLGMALVAGEFLEVLYGKPWVPAAGALSILALTGILKTLGNPSGGILLSRGRSDIGFYWNLAWTAFLVLFIGAFLFIRPTLQMAASAQLIAALTIGWIWHYLVYRFGKVRYAPILRDLLLILLLAMPMVLVLLLIDPLLEGAVVKLAVKVPAGMVIYGLTLLIFQGPQLKELWLLLKPAPQTPKQDEWPE